MIYLDYAANTPAEEAVLQEFCAVTQKYPANPNSGHPLGREAAARLENATGQIAGLLSVSPEEIIYTSGASESNNLAILGAAHANQKYGKHIVTTYLEHSSVNGAMAALQNEGFEVEYADITEDGLVDLDHLRELLRSDTILVSVCTVDSEVGLRQPVEEISRLLAGRPHCVFHTDATQAMGKIPVPVACADLVTFAPHKFYGLNGSGVLLRRGGVLLEPIIHGGVSTTPFRSGTPALGLIAATAKALSLAMSAQAERYEAVARKNRALREALARYPKVRVNSTAHSVPFILNFSLPGVKIEPFLAALGENGVCISSKSACCAANTPSRPVYALTKDRKAALSTLRVSLSHRTTAEELSAFLQAFDGCYRQFVK